MLKQILSAFATNIKNFYQRRLLRGRIILTLIILILVLGIIRISLPYMVIYSATSWLKQHGITSSIETVHIDILNGSFSLINASGKKDEASLFNIGLIDIHWQWTPLSEKTIHITRLALDHFNVNIENHADEIIIGGVNLPLNKSAATATEESIETDVKPWSAALDEIVFTNLDVCYQQHTAPRDTSNDNSRYIDYCVAAEEISWSGSISYATDAELLKTNDIPLSSSGNFSLNGFTVTDNKLDRKLIDSASSTFNNIVISGLNNIHIDSLEMSGLSALQRNDDIHRDTARFQKLAFTDIDITNLTSVAINTIDVDKPGFYLVKNNNQIWEYQQWIPENSSTAVTTDTTKSETSAEAALPLNLSVNNINIKKIDSCYLEKESPLNYCFVFDALLWHGDIKYESSPFPSGTARLSVTGDLELIQPDIHNNILDRNLINFDSLALSHLQLTDLNTVTLGSLTLDNFAAMQRGENKNDYTVNFNKLSIDNINYSKNSIAINTVKLDGLSKTISKQSDGSWEHDKWLTKKSSPEKSSDKKTSADTNTQPFAISLKQLLISSDKKLQFIDNSTKPAMKVGLQSLLLDIKNIDSAKPDADSPIKLSATVSDHSTIKITGTARPLAKKISFNLNGALKGFDLRIASPAANKAIGHIIKSGQLDAELKLLATEGELNSNIALSLYQFHIMARSKQDADKLDKAFGMPLNQTLILLRDKDNSIHLDIPITGDINNPGFSPMDAIIKATSKAATVTLITFYTPYGLIYAGSNVLFDLATALNFDPVSFDPGSAELNEAGKQKLETLNKLLTEKPGIHLSLCGTTNQQDVNALYPKAKSSPADKSSEEVPLSKDKLAILRQLANDRQTKIKNYLVKKHGITHDRLILCEPDHQTDDDAIAGVEINI